MAFSKMNYFKILKSSNPQKTGNFGFLAKTQLIENFDGFKTEKD